MKKETIRNSVFYLLFALFGLLLTGQNANAQLADPNADPNELYDLSLEELMNITIKSASQKEESLFDAPVDSYSITKDQIRKSGVTSIPEAMRLFPGVIVRETSNGNYDIHLRGFDNVARYSGTQDQTNLLTLVMIDDRPVFNYNNGGTNWESLPVDLIDVERIEIVKGPNSPLFGPNAVTGVINIITKKEKEDTHIAADVSYGTPGTTIASLRAGKKLTEKLDLTVSGNYQNRERSDDLYYLYGYRAYSSNIDTASNYATNYGQSDLALRKYGVNAFLTYEKSEDVNFRLSGGYQKADVQKYYLNYGLTSLSPSVTHNNYFALESNIKGFGVRASVINGYENLLKNSLILVSEYDFTNSNVVIDYNWAPSEKLQLRPSFNYQRATYDDSEYVNEKLGLLNGEGSINSYAFSLRGEVKPTESLRIIAAIRADKFNAPNKSFVSYQFAGTQSLLGNNLLLRAAHSKSYAGSFIGHVHVDVMLTNQIPTIPPTTLVTSYSGNSNLNLTSVTNTEVGIRSKITDNLNLDITAFYQTLENVIALVQTDSSVTFSPSGLTIETLSQYTNLPLSADQTGVTLTLNYIPNQKLQFGPFITWQKSDVTNIPLNFVNDETAANNIYNGFNDENRTTPSLYGGFYLNYIPVKKLNVNLNSYYFSSHQTYHQAAEMTSIGEIDSKFIANLKVSYNVLDNLNVYANARNVLNANSREHYGTDRMGGLYLVGLNFNFLK